MMTDLSNILHLTKASHIKYILSSNNLKFQSELNTKPVGGVESLMRLSSREGHFQHRLTFWHCNTHCHLHPCWTAFLASHTLSNRPARFWGSLAYELLWDLSCVYFIFTWVLATLKRAFVCSYLDSHPKKPGSLLKIKERRRAELKMDSIQFQSPSSWALIVSLQVPT